MEDLNKSQLILLAILVSFVTSIATGIMTVSLLNQAPLNVTQTINRVVERTVEKVVPGETKIKEVPVIVTEEELIVKVINNASPAVAKLALASEPEKILGLAYFVGSGNVAITAYDSLPGGEQKNRGPYSIFLENGIKVTVELAGLDATHKLAALKVTKTEVPANDNKILPKSAPTVPVLKLSKNGLLVGQTVITIGSISAETSPVAVGIISSLSHDSGATTTTMIKANAVSADNLGGPLLSIQGEAVGVNILPGSAVSAVVVQSLIDSVK